MEHFTFILSNGMTGVVCAPSPAYARAIIRLGMGAHHIEEVEIVEITRESTLARVWFCVPGNIFRN